uniref:LAGLIDADG homing endonuclease n=1 Tax=Marophrys sp. SRT127 TaxID=2488311 RepID=A0A455RE74_9EUKA|nr:LAGLIDADG homing endonuclease [Marophrys sp. SRT127]
MHSAVSGNVWCTRAVVPTVRKLRSLRPFVLQANPEGRRHSCFGHVLMLHWVWRPRRDYGDTQGNSLCFCLIKAKMPQNCIMKPLKQNTFLLYRCISSLSAETPSGLALSSPEHIILGSLLGDGSLRINKNYKNARFSFRHASKQKEYFFWKRDQLKAKYSAKSGLDCKDWWEQTPSKGEFGKHPKFRYQSRACPELTMLHAYTHKNGLLKIRRKWLNMLTAQSLAIWWCDDGSLVKNTQQGVFCTDSFSLKDLEVLDRYMKKVWGISTKVRPHRISNAPSAAPEKDPKSSSVTQYRLWIDSRQDLEKFLRLILPHIPVLSMVYKTTLLFNDPELQQRWISEMASSLSQFSKQEIENVVAERKATLKNFRSQTKTENDIVQPKI